MFSKEEIVLMQVLMDLGVKQVGINLFNNKSGVLLYAIQQKLNALAEKIKMDALIDKMEEQKEDNGSES